MNNLNNLDLILDSVLLHATGDTIGFKNGDWEFNNNIDQFTWGYVYELINQLIELGGVSGLDTQGWFISDDTVMQLIVMESLLKVKTNDKLKVDAKEVSEHLYQILKKEGRKRLGGRMPGNRLTDAVKLFEKGNYWEELPYRKLAGGSGASMRSMVIGIIFNGTKLRQKLIEIALETSRVTHNNTIGYLGGITSALFGAFAIEHIPIKRWPFELMNILESNIIENYLSKTRGIKEYSQDKDIFINKWKRYIEDKFDKDGKVIYNKAMRDLSFRMRYYYENYGFKEEKIIFPGSGGDDSMIIAYDGLLDAENNWEKLVYYTMVHVGDSDTTGCIAGGLYGLIYGKDKVPINNYHKIEQKNRILDTTKELYNKFN